MTFDEMIDELAHRLASTPAPPSHGRPAGIREMADAIKQAAVDGWFRVDFDQPQGDERFVIRIEDREGRRLKAVIHDDQVPDNALDAVVVIIRAARSLVYSFLQDRAKPDPDDERPAA